MSWYDWLLIAVLLLGMVVRVIGRSIRAHANLKYGNDPDRKKSRCVWALHSVGLAPEYRF